MDNGYVIAFVVIAAFAIGVLRYRNRAALRQAERDDRFQHPRADLRNDREDDR